MRHTSFLSLFLFLPLLVGCTVKDVDAPALAGPSTLANNIILRSSTDTLIQDGVSQAVITITATDANGNAKNIPLRADITVGGVVQDYGRLNTKTPTANGTPLVYTAPPASALAAGQVAQTVTIRVTPMDSGDFRNEVPRQIDIRLVPQGVILPINPNLVAEFTVAPNPPKVLDIVVFDASTSTNNGTACGAGCSYAWDFGDGSGASGQSTTHQYRTVGVYRAALTVTDSRGAQTIKTVALNVGAGTPPTARATIQPNPAGLNQTIFFNASASTAAPGRTIVSYQWDFGKGTTGSGVTTTKAYDAAGTYAVTLTVTDDAGAVGLTTTNVVVNTTAGIPTASFVFSPTAPKTGNSVFFDAQGSQPAATSAPIVSYRWTWGDGTETTTSSPTTSKTFSAVGTYNVRLTVTDSAGRTGTTTKEVAVGSSSS